MNLTDLFTYLEMTKQSFTQITGICVHVINKEKQDVEPPVQHFLLRSVPRVKWQDEDWTVSVVVVFRHSHYEVLVPESLPSDVNITEGITEATGLEGIIEIPDVDIPESVVPKQRIQKYFQPIKNSHRERRKKKERRRNKVNQYKNISKRFQRKGSYSFHLSAPTISFPVMQMIQKFPILKILSRKIIQR